MTYRPPAYKLRLDPVTLAVNHVATSKQMISKAYELADRGGVLVLGCGSCKEIPIETLVAASQLHLVDINEDALRGVRGDLTAKGMDLDGVTFTNEDIMGLIARLSSEVEAALPTTSDAHDACELLVHLIDHAEMAFWSPENRTRYSLIVCSLVLTQLQAVALARLEDVFLTHYPAGRVALATHKGWSRARFAFARRLEEAFVAHLRLIAAPNAILYLSSTIRVCFVKRIAAGLFSTEGSWVAAKTGRLADYFTSGDEIVQEASWPWFLSKRENGSDGRLYDVQALALRLEGKRTYAPE